jgi:hypothetical protein
VSLSMYAHTRTETQKLNVCVFVWRQREVGRRKGARVRGGGGGGGEGGGRRGVERERPKLSLGVCTRKLDKNLHLN